MTAWLISIALSVAVRLLPFAVGLLFWKRYNRGEKALIVLFGYDVVGIIIGAFLAYYYHNNIIMANIYLGIEVVFLSVFFEQFLSSSQAKKWLCWFPIGYIGLFVIYLGYTQQIHENSPPFEAASMFFILSFSAISLSSFDNEDGKIIRQGRFWIVAGLLLFTLLNGGYFVFKYWLDSSNLALSKKFMTITQYSYYLENIAFALGLWMVAKEKVKPSYLNQ